MYHPLKNSSDSTSIAEASKRLPGLHPIIHPSLDGCERSSTEQAGAFLGLTAARSKTGGSVHWRTLVKSDSISLHGNLPLKNAEM